MSTLDPARFGQLYLNKGTWDGNRIVPAQWIQESISVTPLPDQHGDPYGYLWRIIPADNPIGPGYYHTGLGVHALIIFPEKNLVIVHRVDTDKAFDISWEEIKIGIAMALESVGMPLSVSQNRTKKGLSH